jgi:periplasmic protein TonB
MAVSTSSASLFQPQSQQRALLACVAASIALHAGVLMGFPELRRHPAPAPLVLTATLTPVAPQEAAPEKQASVEPPRVRPKPRAAPRPEPHPEVVVPTVPAPAPAASPPEPPAVAEAAPPAPVAALGNEAAAPPAWDGATLQQYRTGLITFAKQFKRYPAQAMERGWEGRVEIRITVRPTGAVDSARVKTPSGYRILDDQALDMVKRALARTPVPPALLGREFSVDIPVIFELQG